MKKARTFATEAALCAAFIKWAEPQGVQCFAEWWGWDILVVYPDGVQLGIQAKLRLNADVIGQALPGRWDWGRDTQGPDYRAILVPEPSGLHGIAARLGLVVLYYDEAWARATFQPPLDGRNHRGSDEDGWLDWNPGKRHDLPPVPTDAIAGSPCPITLTPWKLAALDVLAELAVKGTITTKRMRDLGVNPSRWLSACWLAPGDVRGLWVRADRCPKLDEQHPTAYALALKKAQGEAA